MIGKEWLTENCFKYCKFFKDENKGYVFCVFDMDGMGIKESGPYVYEENALPGARETIDEIIQKKGK